MTLLDHKKLGKLILASRDGDTKAFQKFYEHTAPVQYYQILQMVENPNDASDVLQETYMLLYQNMSKLRDPSSVVAYLNKLSYYICKNQSRSTIRRERRISKLEDAESVFNSEGDPQEVFLRTDHSSQVRKAILELQPQERLVLTMRYLQKMTLQETADAMELSYAKVRRLQHSAKEHLKDILGRKGLYALLPVLPGFAKELGSMIEAQSALPVLAPPAGTSAAPETSGASSTAVPSPNSVSFLQILAKGALITISAGAVVGGAAGLVSSPPEIRDIKLPEKYADAPALLTIQVGSTLTLTECYLQKEGRTYSGQAKGNGRYEFSLSENGSYTLHLKNKSGKTAEKTVAVDSFDETYPVAQSLLIQGGQFIVSFSDGESGIDEESIYYITTEGQMVYPERMDAQTLTAFFPIEKGENTLYFSDKAGNQSNAVLKY